MAKLFGVVGYKDNGKTTLIERVVGEIVRRGLSVSTIKHAHHDVQLDVPGKDTWRHREAGATEVILATSRRFAVLHEARGAEPTLAALVGRLAPVDVVLVEGFKASPHPKIEVHRGVRGTELLALSDPTIVAVASDVALEGVRQPVLALDDVAAITDLALAAAAPCP